MESIILYSDSNRGVYIPRHFAESINREFIKGINLDELNYLIDADIHTDGFYWDTWIDVLDNCIVEHDGHEYRLHHDGDLWLYCEGLMTEQEKQEFFNLF